jgi:hypothetical protein
METELEMVAHVLAVVRIEMATTRFLNSGSEEYGPLPSPGLQLGSGRRAEGETK